MIMADIKMMLEAKRQRQHRAHQVFRYLAGRSFFCNRRSDYRPEAATDAWEPVKALLKPLGTSLPG